MKKQTQTIELKEIKIKNIKIKIKGTSPLIMHRWDEKAKQEMLDKQMKKTVTKTAKNPEEQFLSSIYFLDKKKKTVGFPCDAFKQAMIRGAKQLGLVMTDQRTSFFINGEYSKDSSRDLVPIKGTLEMREDMVRIGNGVADIRFRGQVVDWSAELNITYNDSATSIDHIINMIQAAGYGVGVGEWRPERNGTFGRFEVVKK